MEMPEMVAVERDHLLGFPEVVEIRCLALVVSELLAPRCAVVDDRSAIQCL